MPADCDKPMGDSMNVEGPIADTTFRYEPLAPALGEFHGQIRLLTIVPEYGGEDEPIRCNLQACDRGTAPEYYAISYTWGDPSQVQAISVNGRSMQVRHNCWYVLWQMRSLRPGARFWLDVICIDQTNVLEKNEQVAAMGSIFFEAQQTFVCIGAADTGTETMFSAVRREWKRLREWNEITIQDTDWPHGDRFTHEAWRPGELKEAVRFLLARPYFKRLWVVQEIALSRDAIVFCGLHEVAVAAIQLACDKEWKTMESRNQQQTVSMLLRVGWHRSVFNSWMRTHGGLPGRHTSSDLELSPEAYKYSYGLLRLVSDYKDQKCADPRDKVFALLSLTDSLITPDYSWTAVEVAIEVLRTSGYRVERGSVSQSHVQNLTRALNISVSDAEISKLIQVRKEHMGVSSLAPSRRLADSRAYCRDNLPVRTTPYDLVEYDSLKRIGKARLAIIPARTSTHVCFPSATTLACAAESKPGPQSFQMLFCRYRHVGWACATAQEGDYIIQVAVFAEVYALVARPSSSRHCSIIGHAILPKRCWPEYCATPDCTLGRAPARLYFDPADWCTYTALQASCFSEGDLIANSPGQLTRQALETPITCRRDSSWLQLLECGN